MSVTTGSEPTTRATDPTGRMVREQPGGPFAGKPTHRSKLLKMVLTPEQWDRELVQ